MVKKILTLVVMIIVCLGVFFACDDDNDKGEEEVVGMTYILQEAYDKGFLTIEDLKSIAYYLNRGRTYNEDIMEETYAPMPKNPEVLSEEIASSIKGVLAEHWTQDSQSGSNPVVAKAADFTITEYYGTYNGCVAFRYYDRYSFIMAEVAHGRTAYRFGVVISAQRL